MAISYSCRFVSIFAQFWNCQRLYHFATTDNALIVLFPLTVIQLFKLWTWAKSTLNKLPLKKDHEILHRQLSESLQTIFFPPSSAECSAADAGAIAALVVFQFISLSLVRRSSFFTVHSLCVAHCFMLSLFLLGCAFTTFVSLHALSFIVLSSIFLAYCDSQ